MTSSPRTPTISNACPHCGREATAENTRDMAFPHVRNKRLWVTVVRCACGERYRSYCFSREEIMRRLRAAQAGVAK